MVGPGDDDVAVRRRLGRRDRWREQALIEGAESAAAEKWAARAEHAIYVAAALLLAMAAVFTFVGSVVDLIEGADSRTITDAGVFVLDRTLLLFIIAELLYTLRLVNLGGRILVEPFLFIGIIAVVRKVLVISAEAIQGHRETTDFVVQMGGLAGVALVLAVSIHLLRKSAIQQP